MYLSNRLYVITGLILVAIAICLVAGIGLSGVVTGNDATTKADVPKFLKDVNDHSTLYIVDNVFFVTLDSVIGLIAGALLYLSFRDRSRLLATTILVAFIANSALGGVSDSINLSMLPLAKDFAHGGAGLNAGDPAIQEIVHALGWVSGIIGQMEFTTLSIALLSLTWILLGAPAGNVNPPRPIGWIFLIAGLAAALTWTIAITDAGFVFFIINGLAGAISLLWLGVWLMMRGNQLPVPDSAAR